MAKSETEAKALDVIIPAKGLNLTKQPEVLDPQEGSDGLNIVFADGRVFRRPGTTKVTTTAFTGGAIRHIARHVTRAGTEHLIVVTPTKTYVGVTGSAGTPTITRIDCLEEGVLTLTGTNFESAKGAGWVKVNTVEVTGYKSWSPIMIEVYATQLTDHPTWDVRTNGGLDAVQYTEPIYITSATRVTNSNTTEINGSGFNATRGNGTVVIGGYAVTSYSSWSNILITVIISPFLHLGIAHSVVVTDNEGNIATCYETLT